MILPLFQTIAGFQNITSLVLFSIGLVVVVLITFKLVNSLYPIAGLKTIAFFNVNSNTRLENTIVFLVMMASFVLRAFEKSLHLLLEYRQLKNIDRSSDFVTIILSTYIALKFLANLVDTLFKTTLDSKIFGKHTMPKSWLVISYLIIAVMVLGWMLHVASA